MGLIQKLNEKIDLNFKALDDYEQRDYAFTELEKKYWDGENKQRGDENETR